MRLAKMRGIDEDATWPRATRTVGGGLRAAWRETGTGVRAGGAAAAAAAATVAGGDERERVFFKKKKGVGEEDDEDLERKATWEVEGNRTEKGLG